MLGIGPAEEDHPDGTIVAGIRESLQHLRNGVGRKGVAPGRTIDGHAGDTLGFFIDDVGELPASLPSNFGLHRLKLATSWGFSNEYPTGRLKNTF